MGRPTPSRPGKSSPATPPEKTAPPRQALLPWQRDGLCLLALVGVVVLLYGHTLHAPWYLDDNRSILENQWIRSFDRPFSLFFSKRGPAEFTFAINYALGGLALPGYHIVNIVIHLLNGWLVFLVAKRIFRNSVFMPLFAALIFLAHPLQTQAVTYLVQRMTSLAVLFFFLALYAYLKSREALTAGRDWRSLPVLGWYLSALAAGGLAIISKENTAVLPAALLLFDSFFLPPPAKGKWGWQQRLLVVLPFAVFPLWAFLARIVQPLSAGKSLQRIAGAPNVSATPLEYLVTEFSVIWLYIKLLFVPYPQLLEYNYPTVKTLLTLKNLAAGSGLAAVLGFAFWVRKRRPLLSFGILWFFLGLAVESTFIPLDPVFEHRLYLPMFGFAIFLIGLLQPLRPSRATALLVTVTLIFGGLTWRRNQQWNDDLAFYRDNLARAGLSPSIVASVSKRLGEHGEIAETERLLLPYIEQHPEQVDPYINLSYAYIQEKRLDEAEALLIRMIRQGVANRKALYNLGYIYKTRKDYDKALEVYRQALNLEPRNVTSLNHLGYLLRIMGRTGESEEYYQRTLKGDPGNAEANYTLGAIAYERGDLTTAKNFFNVSLRGRPDMGQTWLSLGVVTAELGDSEGVRKILGELQQRDPPIAGQFSAWLKARKLQPGSGTP